MKLTNHNPCTVIIALLFVALFFSGCSNSNDSEPVKQIPPGLDGYIVDENEGFGDILLIDAGSHMAEPVLDNNQLVEEALTGNSADDWEVFNLLDASTELTHVIAGHQLDKLAVIVDDISYMAAQQTLIQWPDDDYYQLQHNVRSNTYYSSSVYTKSICDGGTECRVLPGSYTLINHTTGERTDLEVPYIDPTELSHAIHLENRIVHDSVDDATVVQVKRTRYNCEFGGSVIVEKSSFEDSAVQTFLIDKLTWITKRTTYAYLFDQCQLTINDGGVTSGTYLVDGSLHTSTSTYGGYSYTGRIAYANHRKYDGFTIIGADGPQIRVHGETEYFSNIYDYFYNNIRKAQITHYSIETPDGENIESMTNAVYHYEEQGGLNEYYRWSSQESSGSASNAISNNQSVTITTETALSGRINLDKYVGNVPQSPFSGTVEIMAEDGSFLNIRANPHFDLKNLSDQWADYDYTKANGERIQEIMREFDTPGWSVPTCVGDNGYHYRDWDTKRLRCAHAAEFAPL